MLQRARGDVVLCERCRGEGVKARHDSIHVSVTMHCPCGSYRHCWVGRQSSSSQGVCLAWVSVVAVGAVRRLHSCLPLPCWSSGVTGPLFIALLCCASPNAVSVLVKVGPSV